MPRQKEIGLHYFSLDCDIFSAKADLKPLLRRFKADGLALYIHILCDVYSSGYYYRPANYEDYLYALSDECGMSVDKVKLILTFMADRTLLDAFSLNKNTVFTSHGIQKHYVEAMKGRKRSVAEIKGEYWLLTAEEEQKLDTFYKSDLKTNKSEKNADKSEKNNNKSEIYPIKEIKENNINITHTARMREDESSRSEELKELPSRTVDEDFSKRFSAFVNRWNIEVDTNSPLLADFDYEKLNEAFSKSEKFLQRYSSYKFLSWIVKNYNSIIKGKYDDHKKEEGAESKPKIKLPWDEGDIVVLKAGED